MDGGASKYTYDPAGGRVRKDTGTNFTEYYYFGGNVLAEQDQAGHWSDYIYAGGKRIAKADLFDTRLHVSATTCNGCTGAYVVFNFNNLGDLNGHTIQAGDKTPAGTSPRLLFRRRTGSCGNRPHLNAMARLRSRPDLDPLAVNAFRPGKVRHGVLGTLRSQR